LMLLSGLHMGGGGGYTPCQKIGRTTELAHCLFLKGN
jgi:hypothetical protein